VEGEGHEKRASDGQGAGITSLPEQESSSLAAVPEVSPLLEQPGVMLEAIPLDATIAEGESTSKRDSEMAPETISDATGPKYVAAEPVATEPEPDVEPALVAGQPDEVKEDLQVAGQEALMGSAVAEIVASTAAHASYDASAIVPEVGVDPEGSANVQTAGDESQSFEVGGDEGEDAIKHGTEGMGMVDLVPIESSAEAAEKCSVVEDDVAGAPTEELNEAPADELHAPAAYGDSAHLAIVPESPVTAAPEAVTQEASLDREQLQKSLRELMQSSSKRVLDLFREWDEDSSGQIDLLEFLSAVHSLGIMTSDADAEALFAQLDIDSSGELQYAAHAHQQPSQKC
jgi:hypothetical protein